jgi:hypothetical protein
MDLDQVFRINMTLMILVAVSFHLTNILTWDLNIHNYLGSTVHISLPALIMAHVVVLTHLCPSRYIQMR